MLTTCRASDRVGRPGQAQRIKSALDFHLAGMGFVEGADVGSLTSVRDHKLLAYAGFAAANPPWDNVLVRDANSTGGC